MAKKKNNSHHSVAKQVERELNRKQIIQEIRSMAATANSRLRALEKAGLQRSSAAYRYIERRHFDKDPAIGETRSGDIKFSTQLAKKSFQQLQHEKRELERFLYEAKTSTVKGVESAYLRSFDSYLKNHPNVNMTREQFAEVASVEGFTAFIRHYGSEEIEELLGEIEDADIDPSEIEEILMNANNRPLAELYAEIREAGRFESEDMGEDEEGWFYTDPWEDI